MAGIYGSDTSTTRGEFSDDLDNTGAELDDEAVIPEDMLRAVTTKAGVLDWAPEDTLDVSEWLGKTGSDAERAELARLIEDLFARDERYASVSALVTLGPENQLQVAVTATTDTGTFELQLEQDGEAMRVVKSG